MITSGRRALSLQDERRIDLCRYRLKNSADSLTVAEDCFEKGLYKDAINRSYYAAFYAVKALLALEEVDFKRHKDVISYFNKTYVAAGKIERDIGRKIARLQQKREKSDYDDFYIASKEETQEQIENTKEIINVVRAYLEKAKAL
jgi:uncharacterized protein (UPF0332 family)